MLKKCVQTQDSLDLQSQVLSSLQSMTELLPEQAFGPQLWSTLCWGRWEWARWRGAAWVQGGQQSSGEVDVKRERGELQQVDTGQQVKAYRYRELRRKGREGRAAV